MDRWEQKRRKLLMKYNFEESLLIFVVDCFL